MMLDPPSDHKCINVQMTWIFGYFFHHCTRHSLWYEDLSDSGLLHELAKVIVLIPFGYSFVHSTDWKLIHGIIRELLPESTLEDWAATVSGYNACNHHKWRVCYDNLEKMYPPGELPRAMAECLAYMER